MIGKAKKARDTRAVDLALGRAGSFLGRGLAALLAAWLGLVAALVGLHAFAPGRLPAVDFVVPDPDLGWRHGADLDLLFYDEGRVALIRTDAEGFRVDGEPDPPRSGSDDVEMVVLGDSFTFAGQMNWAQTFPALLGERLSECRRQSVRVRNLGVAGFGTVQEWLLYKRMVAPTKPDVVIVAFFGNDVADNLPPGPEQSRAALDGASRPWVVIDSAGQTHVEGPEPAAGARVALPIRVVAGTARWAADRIWRTFFDHPDPAATALSPIGLAAAMEPQSLDGQPLGVTEPPVGWSPTAAVLTRLLREIRATGSEAVLVHIGHPAAVERGLAHSFVDESLTAAVAAAAGATFVPLERAFSRYRQATGDALHLLGGRGHWNERGHRLASEMLGNALCPPAVPQNPVPRPR